MTTWKTRPDGTRIAIEQPHSAREIAARASDSRIGGMLAILGTHPGSLETTKSGLILLRRELDLDDVDRGAALPSVVARRAAQVEIVDALLIWLELGVRQERAFGGDDEAPEQAGAGF